MRYIKNGALSQDPWVLLAGDEPVPADVPVIVSRDWLLDTPESVLEGRKAPLGVLWPNDKPVFELAPHLHRLSLVALEFPAFRDGRAYTQARQLREHYGFKGEIRATGDVLRDQFLFMARAGFDAFEVKKVADAEAFAKALREFSVLYQASADTHLPAFRTRLAASRSS
jgi:uncharacterized protein (DUF934 family)